MIVKPFTDEAVQYVFANLWQQGKNEAEAFGVSLDDMRAGYVRRVNQPWSLSFHEYYNALPSAMCYIEYIGHWQYRTHFAATEQGFNRIWMPITLFLKRVSDLLVSFGGDVGYVEVLSDRRNEKAREWFESMGFIFVSSIENVDKYVKTGKMYSQAVGHG